MKLNSKQVDNSIKANITITNTGKYAGKEVVECYVSAPPGTLDKPVKELRAFAKTRLLKPGESQVLSFTLNAEDLASFDPDMSAWVTTAGDYKLQIGASSRNIIQTATFSIPKKIIVGKVHQALGYF